MALRSLSKVAVLFVVGGCLGMGCASSSESAGEQKLTANVGRYDDPPQGIDKPRVGVPLFEITGEGTSKGLEKIAGDQLTTLASKSKRFKVIERAQLTQNLKEQGLEGIVDPTELAKSGKIRGADFLLFGKVSNLRVKAEKVNRGFGFGDIQIPGGGRLGGFDFNRKDSTIKAECGVDIRLVNSTTGEVAVAETSDYTRTDTIGAFGVKILGAGANADADLKIDDDNKGLILRLALDSAMRKMMPELDEFLVERTKEMKAKGLPPTPDVPAPAVSAPSAAAAPSTPAAPAVADPPKEAAAKFCGKCGEKLAADAKFCGKCGTKTE